MFLKSQNHFCSTIKFNYILNVNTVTHKIDQMYNIRLELSTIDSKQAIYENDLSISEYKHKYL